MTWRWAALAGGLFLLVGCGTESAASGAGLPTAPDATRTPSIPLFSPGPTPTRSTPGGQAPAPATCPASGPMITVGPVDAAMGHRAVVVKLTNCHAAPITVDGYPAVTALDARRRPMKLTIAHGMSYMAIDPGPSRIRLTHGQSAVAAIAWSNTVEVAGDNLTGSYLSIAPHAGEPPVIWPVTTDIGTTAKLTLTAWCRKLPT